MEGVQVTILSKGIPDLDSLGQSEQSPHFACTLTNRQLPLSETSGLRQMLMSTAPVLYFLLLPTNLSHFTLLKYLDKLYFIIPVTAWLFNI